MTVWPSGLRRWLQAPVRKGVGSNPTAVTFIVRGDAGQGDTLITNKSFQLKTYVLSNDSNLLFKNILGLNKNLMSDYKHTLV